MIDPVTKLEQWCDTTTRKVIASQVYREGKDVPILDTVSAYRRILNRYHRTLPANELSGYEDVFVRDIGNSELFNVIEILAQSIPRREK